MFRVPYSAACSLYWKRIQDGLFKGSHISDERESKLTEQHRVWERETLKPKLSAAPERKQAFTSQAMNWPVNRLYTPLDLMDADFDFQRDVGFPGEYPYTRGTEANGYRSELWTMMQVSGFGTGEDWAQRGRYMLEQGLTGLFLEYDLPTTNGYDSDHPLAAGEVGRAGIAVDSLADMEALLDLPFDKLQRLTSICNGPQTINLAMILAALERRGVDPDSFTLQTPNAILIEYTCVGRYVFPQDRPLGVHLENTPPVAGGDQRVAPRLTHGVADE